MNPDGNRPHKPGMGGGNMSDMTVATTILNQMGGKRFVFMTGVKSLFAQNNSLFMKLPRNSSKANRLCIKLDLGRDLYVMRFYRQTGGTYDMKNHVYREIKEKDVKVLDGVFCDQLEEIFRDVTGLETRMPKIIWA